MQDTKKQYFNGIQILRCIASICVILCHTKLTGKGFFGVDIFVVITGFLLIHSTQGNTKDFMKKRILKVVPLYWFMTIITSLFVCIFPSLFHSYEFSGTYLWKSLFFIPYEHSGIAQPILGLGWTLNYEMACYVLFWLIMKISMKYRAAILSGICAVLVLAGMIFPGNWFYLDFYGNSLVLEFAYGMGIYYLINYLKKKNIPEWFRRVCGPTAVAAFVLLWELQTHTYRGFVNGLLAVVLVFCFYMWSERRNIGGEHIGVRIGNVNYIIYLLHIYVVRICEKLFAFLPEILISLLSIAGSCILALLWDKLIEQRVQRLLKRMCFKPLK